MDKLYLSMPERAYVSPLSSLVKTSLVAAVHLGFLAWALHASGVIKHQTLALPMKLVTVMIAAPSQPATPETLPKMSAPVLHQAAIALPLLPPSEHKLTAEAPPSVTPSMATSVATAASATPSNAVVSHQAGATAPASEQRSEASFDAAYLNNPAPAYPLISRRQGESGKVLLLVQVTPHGTAAQVEIKQSCGFPRLDEAALEAVRKWHFVPARHGDVAVAASVVVPLSFKLNS
jgi:protein TonB